MNPIRSFLDEFRQFINRGNLLVIAIGFVMGSAFTGLVTALVENVFIGASNELGAFESGVAAQAFGTQVAVVGGGVATLGIVAIYSFFFPSLRRIDTFEELDPARE